MRDLPFSRAACGPSFAAAQGGADFRSLSDFGSLVPNPAASGRAKRRLLLALVAAVLWPPVAARAEKIGEIEVLVQPLPNKDRRQGNELGVSHGYVEYRVQLKNSSAKDHTVELAYPRREEADTRAA